MKDPTPAEVAFIAAYLRTSDPAAAAKEAFPSISYDQLEDYGRTLLKRQVVRQLIRAAMIEHGAMAHAVKETLEQLAATDANGSPLWAVRDRAAERIFRAAGAYDEELAPALPPAGQEINITPPRTAEEVKALRSVIESHGRLPRPTEESVS